MTLPGSMPAANCAEMPVNSQGTGASPTLLSWQPLSMAAGGASGGLTNNLDDLITSAIKGEAEKRGVSYEGTSSESAVQRTTWGEIKSKFADEER